MNIKIKDFFDPETFTFTYVVEDINTKKAVIIDPVLGFDQFSGKTNTEVANDVINFIVKSNLSLELILETHIHADHLTGSSYIKEKLGGKVCVSSKIRDVLKFWLPIFNITYDSDLKAKQFDILLEDNEEITFGNTKIKVIHTPGHTPACLSYLINDHIFVGDTIFMPDLGTARADFPGGSPQILYESIQKILDLPDDIKIYHCHDYPPKSREVQYLSNVKEQKNNNIMINRNITKEEYIKKEGRGIKYFPFPNYYYHLYSSI